MGTLDQNSSALVNVAIAVGIVSLIAGAAYVFFPEFTSTAFSRAMDYLNIIPQP